MKEVYSKFLLGDMCAVYLLDTESQICGVMLVPAGFEEQLAGGGGAAHGGTKVPL